MTGRDEQWWGVAEAASHCGIKPSTWRDYVARGHAPAPDDPDDGAPPNRRRPRWRAETVTAWHASRPGHGGRPRRRTVVRGDGDGDPNRSEAIQRLIRDNLSKDRNGD